MPHSLLSRGRRVSIKASAVQIDFVFADEAGALYALELKRSVQGPGDAWRVLAQVTYRAVKLHETRGFEKLQAAFALSRTHEARNTPRAMAGAVDLLECHREFFGLQAPLAPEAFLSAPVERVVAAQHFGGAWEEVRGRFVTGSEVEILTHLGGAYRVSSARNRELRRLVEVGAWRHLVAPTISLVNIG